ncbi:selenocysteine-specific translation elongation factor [Desulfonema limicola]|uniref:selenocysteine-specific translation elongation factor n=1 Tax=Desulfonema limicola TaxID=45656 RepID=UPI0030840313
MLGTAGHIDHGKTTFIKALTGINTDRLKEEQRRGITIELGFASLDLPNGFHVGIVDVPGHEKFVKNMVAGATGIDVVAMIIAADEGVMPQTREHMEICSLLGIKSGLVVLTKVDMVDEEWLELVTEDVKEFTKGSFLEGQPVVPVSGVTGQGIPEFMKTLEKLSISIPQRTSTGLFRLPVDRVFTMKGFGTVITGTLTSGRVSVGETIMIYPSLVRSKVRGLQVHNQSVESAEAGMRTAINFQGLEKTSVNRGDVLSNPDALKPSYMLDISIQYLKSNKKPVKNRTRVRFHAGTNEILANLILLEAEELLPGKTAVAQLRLESPVALVKDDRFVIRSYSPVRTIGGGYILNPIPKKHKRFRPEVIAGLKELTINESGQIIPYHIRESAYQGVSFFDLKIMTNMPEQKLRQALQSLLSAKTIVQADREKQIYIHQDSIEKLKNEITQCLSLYHKTNPLKTGISKEELRNQIFSKNMGYNPDSSIKLFNLMINHMSRENAIVQEEDMVRLANHKISLGADQADVKKQILETYTKSGLAPPYFKDLCQKLNLDNKTAKDVLMTLVDEGIIIKVKEDLYFNADYIYELKNRLVDFLKKNEQVTTPQFKEIAGVSRKFFIPLIEYFDSKNITIRIGDIRKLRSN